MMVRLWMINSPDVGRICGETKRSRAPLRVLRANQVERGQRL